MAPILGYWCIRGIVTPIRLLLSYADVQYEYKEYDDYEAWFTEDKVKFQDTLDFPNLPYYIDDEVKLTQTQTIAAYLGRKYNLDGANDKEELRMSLAIEQVADMKAALQRVGYVPMSASNRTEVHEILRQEYLESIPARLALFSKFLGTNKWIVGDHLTYADFLVYDGLDFHRLLFNPKHFNAFPTLVAYMERIEALKGVKEYVAKMDKMPTFSPLHALFGNTKDYKPSD